MCSIHLNSESHRLYCYSLLISCYNSSLPLPPPSPLPPTPLSTLLPRSPSSFIVTNQNRASHDFGSRGFTAAAIFTLTLFGRGRIIYGQQSATYFEDAGQRQPLRDVATIMQYDMIAAHSSHGSGPTRWLYCVECPQYSTRLKALGCLCDCLSGRVQRSQVVKVIWHKAHCCCRWMVQCYSTGDGNVSFHKGTLAPHGEYDWTLHLLAHSSPQPI